MTMTILIQKIIDLLKQLLGMVPKDVVPSAPVVGEPRLTAEQVAKLRSVCHFQIPESDEEISKCTQLAFNIEHYGWNENNPEQNKYISQFWKYAGLPNYNSISGRSNAWCALDVIISYLLAGFSIKNLDASAVSGLRYANKLKAYKFGCGAVIQHSSGGHHVTQLVAPRFGLGGNQSDSINVAELSSSDKILGYFWPVKA